MELDTRLKQKVATYQVTNQDLARISQAPLLFAVGITAAGKNALLHRLLQLYPDDYHFSVSHTSRAPRENHGIMEQDGVEYHFVDLPTIEHMLDNHEFIEAQVIHNAWISGSSIAEIADAYRQGLIAAADVDVQGAEEYVKLGLHVKPVFILPPSYNVWRERLLLRYEGKPHKHDLVLRMQSAIKEIEHALAVDYFYIVINDDLDKTVELVNQIAHGELVDPHYHKAIAVAQELLARIRVELAKMV
jgi:guanylate kinase